MSIDEKKKLLALHRRRAFKKLNISSPEGKASALWLIASITECFTLSWPF